jgi:hypothetical protein
MKIIGDVLAWLGALFFFVLICAVAGTYLISHWFPTFHL